MWTVEAYTIFNTTRSWEVESQEKAREYAKRIIMEGLWYFDDNGNEVFLPVHEVVKVKIYESGPRV